MKEGWTDISGAAEYLDLKPRTLRGLLKDGLPHVRLNRKTILIKYSDIDSWLERLKVMEANEKKAIDHIVSEFCQGL
jgi:excisionase family DNA binding protein